MFEKETTDVFMQIIDNKVLEAEQELKEKKSISEDKMMYVIMKAIVNHMTHLELDLRGEIKELRSDVDKRFEQVDKQFEQVDKRFEQVDKRLENMESRFNWITGLVVTVLFGVIANIVIVFVK